MSKKIATLRNNIPRSFLNIIQFSPICGLQVFLTVVLGCAHSHSIIEFDDPSTSAAGAVKAKVYVDRANLKVQSTTDGFPSPREAWLELEREYDQANAIHMKKGWQRLRMSIPYSREDVKSYFGSFGDVAVRVEPIGIDARRAGCFAGDDAYIHMIGFKSEHLKDIPKEGMLSVKAKLKHETEWIEVQRLTFTIGSATLQGR